MNINYENSTLHSKNVLFEGETDNGKKFTINANWNQYDDWNVEPEDIIWEDEEGTEEEIQQIIEEFENEMN